MLNNKKNNQNDNSSTTNTMSSSSLSVSSSQINTSSIDSIDDGVSVSGGGAVKDNGTSLILYPPQVTLYIYISFIYLFEDIIIGIKVHHTQQENVVVKT